MAEVIPSLDWDKLRSWILHCNIACLRVWRSEGMHCPPLSPTPQIQMIAQSKEQFWWRRWCVESAGSSHWHKMNNINISSNISLRQIMAEGMMLGMSCKSWSWEKNRQKKDMSTRSESLHSFSRHCKDQDESRQQWVNTNRKCVCMQACEHVCVTVNILSTQVAPMWIYLSCFWFHFILNSSVFVCERN